MNIKLNWDSLGIATSITCAIHCALLPVFISSLPVFGINIVHNSLFEWGMIALAFVVGSFALFHGYGKHHKSFIPFLIFLTGFVSLVLKQFIPAAEYKFLTFAVLLIVSAHVYNYRLCHINR